MSGWGGRGGGLWFPVLAVCAWPESACRRPGLPALSCFPLVPPPPPPPPGEGAARDWAVAFGGTPLPGYDCLLRPGHRGPGYGSQEATSSLSKQCCLAWWSPQGQNPPLTPKHLQRPQTGGKVWGQEFPRPSRAGVARHHPGLQVGWGWKLPRQKWLICMVSLGRRWGEVGELLGTRVGKGP